MTDDRNCLHLNKVSSMRTRWCISWYFHNPTTLLAKHQPPAARLGTHHSPSTTHILSDSISAKSRLDPTTPHSDIKSDQQAHANMTRQQPWTLPELSYLMRNDPQPRDPGNGKSPNRPRPSKPVQPRDDGESRRPVLDGSSFARKAPGGGKPKPRPVVQPRDGESGRLVFVGPPQLEDSGNACFCAPRRSGRKYDPQPRDPGISANIYVHTSI